MTDVLSPELLESDAARLAAVALREDGPLDITSKLSLADRQEGVANFVSRETLVVAGTAYASAVAEWCALPPIEWLMSEGDTAPPGAAIARLNGNMARLLRAERPMLNFLQRAGGIATLTRRFVEQMAGTECRVLHTRKTTPGNRIFEVVAVLAGGGAAHRLDLASTVMIKDNHWVALRKAGRTLADALQQARSEGITSLQVEVESREQLVEACQAGATRVLLDNQTPGTVAKWTSVARGLGPSIQVEATGGITLETAASFAAAGVDFVSTGALTHSARSVDIGLDF